jgi:hypothetical protein
MSQTVNSSLTAYALPTDLTDLRSWVAIADLLEDPSTSTALPTRTLNRAAVEAHALVARSLKWASSEIESAVTAGQRYDPLDLQALLASSSVGAELLKGLTCDLAFWWLTKRRKTGAKIQDIAGCWDAFEKLDRLKAGERIFPFADAQSAGLPEVSPLDANGDVVRDSVPVTQNAFRMFGCRGSRWNWQ